MKIVTHSGAFHADDLLAVAILLLKYPEAEVIRSRDDKMIEAADIAVDVGLIYDPEKMRFDHHQPAGAGERSNGIPYASVGLVWKHFGEELAGGADEAKVVDEKILTQVDAKDNAIDLYTPIFADVPEYTLDDYFKSFSGRSSTMEELDKGFFEALPVAQDLIKREIASAQSSVADWKEVRQAYNESANKQIVILEKRLHWKRALIPTEAIYAVWPRTDGWWSATAVPKNVNSFEYKRRFPTSWAGLEDTTLQSVSGEPSAVFCHRDRHLLVAKTKEGAIKLAEISLNS